MTDVTVPQKVIDEFNTLTADGFDTWVLTLENGEVTGQIASTEGTAKDDFRSAVYDTVGNFDNAYILHAVTGNDGQLKWILASWEETTGEGRGTPGDRTVGTAESVAQQLGGITKTLSFFSINFHTEDEYKRSGIASKLADI
jgi:hypothetical protein